VTARAARDLPPELEDMVEVARIAMGRAYAPYSGFLVGSAVLADGTIFAGQNVEIASYPLSVCAERNAVAAMIGAGVRSLQGVVVVTGADRPTPPCGACRQVLWEFGPDAFVVAQNTAGTRLAWSLRDLLPAPFGPDDLA
jgi:cytidine deaminase